MEHPIGSPRKPAHSEGHVKFGFSPDIAIRPHTEAGLGLRVATSGTSALKSWEVASILFVLLAALGLRLIRIDATSLWIDEALSITRSKWSLIEMIMYPTDPTPPLYYLLQHLFLTSDLSAGATRIISVFSGVAGVFLMYILGRLAFGSVAGLISAAFLAVWTSHVEYSQEARGYSVLVALTLTTSIGLLIYCHTLVDERRNLRTTFPLRALGLTLFAVGNVASFYTHIVSVFWIAATSLILLAFVSQRPYRAYFLEFCIVSGLMTLCALPGLYWLYQSMSIGHSFTWLQQRTITGFIGEIANVMLPAGLWDNPWITPSRQDAFKLLTIVAASGCFSAAIWLKGRAFARLLRANWVIASLIIAYLILPFLVWVIGFISQPILMARTILIGIPGFILLITGLSIADSRTLMSSAILSLLLVYGLSTLLFIANAEKEDWRGATAYLADNVQPGDVIAVCPAWSYPALRHAVRKPISSSVITAVPNGSVEEIEPVLGTDENWDTTYHQLIQTAELERRIGRSVGRRQSDHSRSNIRIQPGRSVWRVDSHCNSAVEGRYDVPTDVALDAIDLHPSVVWRQMSRYDNRSLITIRRYQAAEPGQANLINRTPNP